MIVRAEKPDDIQKISAINLQAFETNAEANIVETLRNSGIPLISLVAEKGGEILGHILFSPVTLEGCDQSISIAGLAPMAVLPKHQKKGIGSRLVEEGIRRCEEAGYDAVVVLGHPEYYPKFGFVPSVSYGIRSEYNVPDEVFMVKELKESALADCKGTVKYHKVFTNAA
jgi:putative acetyltransferase